MIGLLIDSANVLAEVATILSAGPSPGPRENDTRSISSKPRPASSKALGINFGIQYA